MKVFLNGDFLDERDAKVSVFDRGFLYGDGIFETIRFSGTKPFGWTAHTRRLFTSLKEIGIELSYSPEELLVLCQKVIELNDLSGQEAYLRITVTRGVSRELRDLSSPAPTIFIYARGIDLELIEKRKKEGIKAVLVPFSRGDFAYLKHTGYLPSLLAFREAAESEAEPIFTCGEEVLEGATSNIFLISDKGHIITPKDRILKGVMRNFVIQMLRDHSFHVEERTVYKGELRECLSIFITNSIQEIVPVRSIDDKIYNIESVREVIDLFNKIKGNFL